MIAASIWFVLSAAAAAATVDPAPDRIGIYFDESADQRRFMTWPSFLQTVHITVTNPTFANIYGWQAAIRGFEPVTGTVIGTSIAGGAVINGPELQFDIRYEEPLIAQPVTVLATIMVLMQGDPQRSCLVLTGVDQPAIPEALPLIWAQPDQPAAIQVACLYGNGIAAAMYESPIPEDPGCASVVANSVTSWSSLKALFR
jgi:hypothetical protein